jgi:hypothetical protein
VSSFFNTASAQQSVPYATNRWQAGTVQATLAVGGLFGFEYAIGLSVADFWFFEYHRGTDSDFNLGGADYYVNYYGIVCNRFYRLSPGIALSTSGFYSKALVVTRNAEFQHDFARYGILVGFDFASHFGLGSYIRGGLAWATDGYMNGKTTFQGDAGLYYRFPIFGAP